MAGGKETPRQKMIGMMYLVLTALLALNVSSAILLKFQFLDSSLQEANSKSKTENAGILGGMVQTIEGIKKEGGTPKPKDLQALTKAEEVREQTKDIVEYIQNLRASLVEKSGGTDPETGNYTNPEGNDIVASTMIGGGKNGEAYELKNKLDAYTKFLRQYSESVPPSIALSGSEDPVAKNDPNQKNKDFAVLNFEDTPLVAALAVLSQKESEVLKYEATTLQRLAQEMGADVAFTTEDLFAMARAESKVVAAGTKYKADLMIAASSASINPKMYYQGKPIRVENGRGQIEFTAAASNYDADGNSKQTWKGQIVLKQNGRDTTYEVTEEYIVAKPVIQVQSAAVQALYLGAANELNIQVPALGVTYDPSFNASGGTAIKGAKKGVVTVIPNSAQVKLSVSSAGNAIGTETFNVKPIPKPEVVALVNGRPYEPAKGVSAAAIRTMDLQAIADEGFKSALPNEARYMVTSGTAMLVQGGQLVDRFEFNGPSVNLARFAQRAKKGDQILVEVDDVKRLNYQGTAVNAGLGNRKPSFTVILN
ncbi:gliding motility protein GldM [Pontibacter harenae]|uniref:type IX secretion system motor protein PorM/GldM n=1 Tax=Pontibacter harenae TaxID=2894083 RepID=UPI001E30321A|nr:gliding motility protein GldM [Pontibacter harenae]MCC9168455.1 gliding motility protein GldM [Pontibacter harenae]